MKRILVPVDGSAVADRAVEFAISQAVGRRIVLLNVQQDLERWHRHGLRSEQALADLRRQGESETACARALLDKSGVGYDFEVVFGHPAEVIVRIARERACESIVMGTRGLGDVESLVLGSTAHKVIHLAGVPVTLVK